MKSLILLFATFSIAFSSLSDYLTDIQLPFNNREQQCYYFDIQEYSFQIDIEVEDDNEHGSLNVDLIDPDNQVIVHEVDTYSQHIRWPLGKDGYLSKTGMYQVCIENMINEQTQVQLIIRVTEKNNTSGIPRNLLNKIHKDKNYGALESLMSLSKFDDITAHMVDLLEESRSTLSKVSFRLHTHIDEVNLVAKRVVFFASMISGCVVLIAVLQIMSIRAMFNERSKYGSLLRHGRPTTKHYY